MLVTHVFIKLSWIYCNVIFDFNYCVCQGKYFDNTLKNCESERLAVTAIYRLNSSYRYLFVFGDHFGFYIFCKVVFTATLSWVIIEMTVKLKLFKKL